MRDRGRLAWLAPGGQLSTAPARSTYRAERAHVMNDYCTQALEYLRLAYDPQRALFSYSTRLDNDGRIVNDFRFPESLGYTLTTYLGLTEAQRHRGPIDWLGNVTDRVHDFLELHEDALSSPVDQGLLLVLLAAVDRSHPAVQRSFDRIERILADERGIRRLNMLDLAWMLWGTATWADEARAPALAGWLFKLVWSQYVHPATGLPRHSVARYRAHTVSFGSTVYFLRAMYEHSEAFGSDVARDLFVAGVERVLEIQGPDGAWPWMIDVRSGLPFDIYPIFTVHQDSMALLFLLPAERCGVAGVLEAIERSVKWNFGHNELSTRMVQSKPYPWIYRSIQRDERSPRARRYLRGLGPASRGYPARSPSVCINRECRSYHLGWVLYTWSGTTVMPLVSIPSTRSGQHVAT